MQLHADISSKAFILEIDTNGVSLSLQSLLVLCSWPLDASDHPVQLGEHLVLLLYGLSPLRLGDLELLFQFSDEPFLVLLGVFEAGEIANEKLDLLFLVD